MSKTGVEAEALDGDWTKRNPCLVWGADRPSPAGRRVTDPLTRPRLPRTSQNKGRHDLGRASLLLPTRLAPASSQPLDNRVRAPLNSRASSRQAHPSSIASTRRPSASNGSSSRASSIIASVLTPDLQKL